MAEHEILAEKFRALLSREAPRDAYDVWMLLQKNVKVDKKLLQEKLKEEGITETKIHFPEEKIYLRDLKQLLENVPSYNQVKEEVTKAIMPMLK